MKPTHVLWSTFTELLTEAATLGQMSVEPGETVIRGALAGNPQVARGITRLLATLRAKPDLLSRLNDTASEQALKPLLENFKPERLRAQLVATSPLLVDLTAQAIGRQVLAMAPGEEDLPVKHPAGTEKGVKEGSGDDAQEEPGGAAGGEDDDGDSPGDTPPPNVYGEELDHLVGGLHAISINTVHCDDPTGWGPSGQLDDEIAWHVESRQEFEDISEPIVAEFVSNEYEDVSAGDTYSALDDLRNPRESGTKIALFQDDRLCPRLFRPVIKNGRRVLAEEVEAAFKLEEFKLCRIKLTLFEVGTSLESIIREILRLVLHLTGLGVGAGTALNPAGLIQNALGAQADNSLVQESLRRLEEFISDLLDAKDDEIGTMRFLVRRDDIEAAFAAGPVKATPHHFEYVDGEEQEADGKDAKYRIRLRYEKHG